MTHTTRVLTQRPWTSAELKLVGFKQYPPIKRLVMARVLPPGESPKQIDNTHESLIAQAGDLICYTPGDYPQPSIEDYKQWPIRADLFLKNYRSWDEPNWKPTPAEAHLWKSGCRPYYKAANIWAMHLQKPVYIQSLESPEPVLVPAGRWLCIGVEGEPYHMSDESFRARYLIR